MTPLARFRSDQFIDLLGEVTEPVRKPEPGYRRQPKPDWLSEFADEDHASANDLVLPNPPLSLDLEPETATRAATTGRLALVVPMAFLAVVSAAIAVIPVITRPGDLPEVRGPARTEAAPLRSPSAPLPDAVPSAPDTRSVGLISRDPRPGPRGLRVSIPEAQPRGLRSLPLSGSSPHEIETAAVQDVLDRYRASLATSSTAGIEFHSCGVELSAGGRATARCTGRATFVPKISGRSERVESRAWSFGLSRVNDRWTIVSVESR